MSNGDLLWIKSRIFWILDMTVKNVAICQSYTLFFLSSPWSSLKCSISDVVLISSQTYQDECFISSNTLSSFVFFFWLSFSIFLRWVEKENTTVITINIMTCSHLMSKYTSSSQHVTPTFQADPTLVFSPTSLLPRAKSLKTLLISLSVTRTFVLTSRSISNIILEKPTCRRSTTTRNTSHQSSFLTFHQSINVSFWSLSASTGWFFSTVSLLFKLFTKLISMIILNSLFIVLSISYWHYFDRSYI